MELRTKQDWEDRLNALFPKLKPKIGIGLNDSSRIDPDDIEKCKDFCTPIIVGKKEASFKKDYEVITNKTQPTEQILIDLLKAKEINGIVKFDNDGIKLRNLYMNDDELHSGYKLKYLNRCSIVSFEAKEKNSVNTYYKTILLFPISPEEGSSQNSLNIGLTEAYNELLLFAKPGENVNIGLLSLCREKTYENKNYDPFSRQSYKEMEDLKSELNSNLSKCVVEHHNIELESAFLDSDIICAYRGGYGRLVYRSILFAGANSFEIASPSLAPHPYVGGTKNTNNLLMRIKYAVAKYGSHNNV